MTGEIKPNSAQQQRRLLLVEDDPGVRRSLQLLLRARGFDVRAYAAGAALLADPLANQACCFVADYSMDELDGLEVLTRLKSRGWAGPAILITAFPTPALKNRAMAAGFSVVLEKPFREHVLADTVTRLTGQTGTFV
ncbi:MAG: response regulator [Sphingobium sp.]|uniref:response regulator n=1 Tax=Sphingobium sp. TaxID=1912891 RepID=UPI0029B891F1|nr:response regulator [Sphingobium sp.]MDX3910948.1 response regulator [Sphingobium sp.]